MSENETTAGEEGENYFVSMTDMMVGVLFIFIIMLMSFALDFRRNTDIQEDSLRVVNEVARKLDALQGDVQNEIGRLDKASRDRSRLLGEIRSELASEGLKVDVDVDHGVLRLTEDAVRFDVNKSDLKGPNKQNVDKIARALDRVLRKYAPCQAGQEPSCHELEGTAVETLFIEGHTDETGIDANNWQLSTARAVSTYQQIIAGAPRLRSLRNGRQEEIISVSGYAATRPLARASTQQAWAANRRIDLRFVMETENREALTRILKVTNDMRGQIDRLGNAIGDRK
jgi:outer membrane protein OmpA-like peptidoglycan-associated protein